MTRDIIILLLMALTMFQAGYIFNEYLEYAFGPVPLATTQDIMSAIEGAQ